MSKVTPVSKGKANCRFYCHECSTVAETALRLAQHQAVTGHYKWVDKRVETAVSLGEVKITQDEVEAAWDESHTAWAKVEALQEKVRVVRLEAMAIQSRAVTAQDKFNALQVSQLKKEVRTHG